MFGTIRSANLCRVEPRIWFIGEKSYENKLSGGGKNQNLVKVTISGFSISENLLQKYNQCSLKTS